MFIEQCRIRLNSYGPSFHPIVIIHTPIDRASRHNLGLLQSPGSSDHVVKSYCAIKSSFARRDAAPQRYQFPFHNFINPIFVCNYGSRTNLVKTVLKNSHSLSRYRAWEYLGFSRQVQSSQFRLVALPEPKP